MDVQSTGRTTDTWKPFIWFAMIIAVLRKFD